ncbi:transposase [Ileibacterium valens]|uniref:transposase n=1 Tax=Ileibacterium valens TaxID=1862668 RepID=UPI0022B869E8|nr:transposase [Ileibacterium valens]
MLFEKTFGCVRFVYNYYLDIKIPQYQMDQSSLNYTWYADDLAKLLKTEDYAFLKEVDCIALKQSLYHLDNDFQDFFRNPAIGFPKFKSKKANLKSCTTLWINGNVAIKDDVIRLAKVGLVKIELHCPIPSDKLKSVTISQSPSEEYYASILFEYENQAHQQTSQKSINLVHSMPELSKDPDGKEPKYPSYYYETEKKLKREKRKLSRMVKGSNNWNKQRIKVDQIHEKMENQRKDFLYKQPRTDSQ